MSVFDWDDLRARHRLADVARRSGIEVGQSGRVLICCPVPAHHDTTPSARLDLDRDRYHCFGCGAHGDVIDWVRDVEGVDTAAAVAILESRGPINAVFATGTSPRGYQSRRLDPPQLDRTSAERVTQANQVAWDYYSYGALRERGLAYLASRGIDITALEAEVGAPVVGHTPSSRTRVDGLVSHLAARGFSDGELIDAGLATRLADGCVIDLFRDRVILPVRATTGATSGVLGRDITGQSRVKYLNPPTTATYRKSQALYRPTQPTLRPDGAVVVCEGPLDALAIAARAATAGVSDRFAPLAACGRVLSDHQIETILALHRRAPVLAADGDGPGRQANLDWARRMLAQGRESVITDWPEGYDPASWLAERGATGLMAVSRRGCLDDLSGILRPRHCGVALTEADFPDHDADHRPSHVVFLDAVAKATAPLPSAARNRYRAAAVSVFAPPGQPTQRASPWVTTSPSPAQDAPVERIDL